MVKYSEIKNGDRFGRLTVIANDIKRNGHRLYRTRCECGNEKVYFGHNLRDRVCCGCTKSKRPGTAKNLIGDVFGDIKVIDEVGIKGGGIEYSCECLLCGTRMKHNTARLMYINKHKIKKCKHCRDNSKLHIKSLVGKRVGGVTVLALASSVGGLTTWNCLCDCGETRVIARRIIREGETKGKAVMCFKCLSKMYSENLKKIKKNTDTYKKNTIEIMVEKYLHDGGVQAEYSFVLDDKHQFDFIVGGRTTGKILIEVQGDYWHTNPEVYKNGPIFETQRENIVRDKNKKEYAEKRGYTIYYIWEKDIRRKNFSSLYPLLPKHQFSAAK